MNETLKNLAKNYPSYFIENSDEEKYKIIARIKNAQEELGVSFPEELTYFLVNFKIEEEFGEDCMFYLHILDPDRIAYETKESRALKEINEKFLVIASPDEYKVFMDVKTKELYEANTNCDMVSANKTFFSYLLEPVFQEIGEKVFKDYGFNFNKNFVKMTNEEIEEKQKEIINFDELLEIAFRDKKQKKSMS